MNILFVNYGDFTTNSLNHIGGFANWLVGRGHSCMVAVPQGRDTFAAVHRPQFSAATFTEVFAAGANIFPDGRPADLIHAWTPRETVRKFILAHQRLQPATRVLVHLEDNEEHLASAFSGTPLTELRQLPDDTLAARLTPGLPHPRRYRQLLAIVDGVTHIVPRLAEFIPTTVPHHDLPPGVDFDLYHPQPVDAAYRRTLGLAPHEKVIVYTGSTTFANRGPVHTLLQAVRLLNERGLPVRLVRTGFHPEEFHRDLGFDWRPFTRDLGFIAKEQLPALLALADVLVQPGAPGDFDDYRLPSKLPEFLAAGRPVVTARTNLGLVLRDGHDALLLSTGTAREIVDAVERLLTEPALAATIATNAAAFARTHFDLEQIGPCLLGFYNTVLAAPARASWRQLGPVDTESVLLPGILAAQAPGAARELALLADTLRAAEHAARHSLGQELSTKLHADIARLESARELTRQHVTNLERELAKVRASFDELKGINAALRRQLYNYQAELVRTAAELDHERRRLGDHLADREKKIRQMQATFSWQATAPLRALRRQFLDQPPVTARAVPEPAPAAPAPSPQPRCHIDEPLFWHLPAGPLVIRGWGLLPNGQAPARVRGRVGEREFAGVAGLARPDVAAVHGTDLAARCGFRVDLVLEAGRPALVLEAADEHGEWHPLLRPTLTVFSPAIPPEAESYTRWLHLYDPVSPATLQELRTAVSALPQPPLISVLIPVYNTPVEWLRRAIGSVQAQVYENWELCIANDASPAPHVRPMLDTLAATDPRIKVVHREANGHISLASNSALDLASGAYVALLDHDDELSPRALARMVLEIARHPDAIFLYSDEDKIDERGSRFDPYFKPDFLPDLLLGQNCLSHLSVIRTDAIRQVGGFRAGLEGSQDWDLALRVVEDLPAERVRHVPEVLYHWRAIAGSTALAVGEKSYTVRAAERALGDHLARRRLAATLAPVPGDHWRIRYTLPDPAPLVSLIIPTRDRLALTRTCVESILAKTDYPRYEILILDNQSVEPATLAWFAAMQARDPRVKVLSYPQPFNYSALNNFGVAHAAGEIVGLLNNDLEVITPGWLTEMVSHAVRPGIGAVGAMLYYPDDRIQHAGIILGLGGVANHAFYRYPRGTDGYKNRARLVQNFSAVTGACLLVRKTVYLEVGGLNADQLPVAFNDVDFCLKVRTAGYRNLWTPFAELYHHESASRGTEDTPEKLARFAREVDYMRRTWGPQLDADPSYNPNFSLEIEGFKLACPPREASLAKV